MHFRIDVYQGHSALVSMERGPHWMETRYLRMPLLPAKGSHLPQVLQVRGDHTLPLATAGSREGAKLLLVYVTQAENSERQR